MADIAQENIEVVGGTPARAVKHVSTVLDDCAALSRAGTQSAHDRMERIANAVLAVELVKIAATVA